MAIPKPWRPPKSKEKMKGGKVIKKRKMDFDINQIIESYCKDKLSTREIAEKLGCGKTTIQKRLKRLKLSRSKSEANEGKQIKITDSQIREAYDKYNFVRDIAKQLKVSPEAIRYRIKKMGLKIQYKIKRFTSDEIRYLKDNYEYFCNKRDIAELAEKMGRKRIALFCKASELGLTKNIKPNKFWKNMSREEAGELFDKFKNTSLGVGCFCKKYCFTNSIFSGIMKKYFPDEWDLTIESKTPKSSKYKLGRAFEYRCRDFLKKEKYFVLRSPRSAGPVDLIAIKKGILLFIQCKRGGAIETKEWNLFFKLCESVNAIPILAESRMEGGIMFNKMLGLCKRNKGRKYIKEIFYP